MENLKGFLVLWEGRILGNKAIVVCLLLFTLIAPKWSWAFAAASAAGPIGTSHKTYVPVIPERWGFNSGPKTGFGFEPLPRDGTPWTIMTVDNLNDSGPGSLRHAFQSSIKNRIIVCNVSGRIRLSGNIWVGAGNMIFAGQTCPSPGLSYSDSGIMVYADNVVIRHLRCQAGSKTDVNPGNVGQEVSCIMNRSHNNIVFDHITTMWQLDEGTGSAPRPYPDGPSHSNFYVLDSILTEGLTPKTIFCMKSISFMVYRTLIKNSEDRNPRMVTGCQILFVNNFLYDVKIATTVGGEDGDTAVGDFKANRYVKNSGSFRVWRFSTIASAKLYLEGNKVNHKSVTADEWANYVYLGWYRNRGVRSNTPHWIIPGLRIIPLSDVANPLWDDMKNSVGAMPAFRDAADSRQIDEVQDCLDGVKCKTGYFKFTEFPPIAKNIRGKGGVPKLNLPPDPWVIGATGHTAIEMFINNCAAKVETPNGSQC